MRIILLAYPLEAGLGGHLQIILTTCFTPYLYGPIWVAKIRGTFTVETRVSRQIALHISTKRSLSTKAMSSRML
uniref:Uncharacterized protein n=1 Tax=Picea glauca TaxID=3330 RepID=A0A117NIM6_PICGL|nr:hypothetical protein ABT39_MTgene51 [Picea glauca]